MKTKSTIFQIVKKLGRIPILIALITFVFSDVQAQLVTIGTGTTTNGSSSYPSPYANYYWGAKHQMLIPASEILAAGGTAGTIQSVAFDVSAVNSCPALSNFYVKIGTTSASALSTTWISGLTSVYTNSSYSPSTGWNTHTFTTPFVWDGTSNIVIETCFNNSSWVSGGNASVRRSNTSYGSTHLYRGDNSSVCSSTSTSGNYSYRPNMKLMIVPAVSVPCNLGILSWDAPTTPTGCTPLSATDTVKIKVKNYGTASQSNFALSYSINGGTTYITPEIVTTALAAGDTLDYSFTTTANMAAGGNYNCEAAVYLLCDTIDYNDTMKNIIVENNVINTFPYFENLESYSNGTMSSGNWASSTTSNPAWTIDVSTTSSSNTGPNKDHTLGTSSGKYAYLETSGGSTGSTSYLTSPCLSFGSVPLVKLKFWYHMYGSSMGTLEVQQLVSGSWITTGWSKTGQQHSSMGAAWSEALISLNPLAEKIRFKGVRGTSYTGDMAIDDIEMFIPATNDLAIIEWVSPLSGMAPSATMPITIKVKNEGIETQDTIPLKYSIDAGTTIISEVSNDSLPPGDTLTYTFTTLANMLNHGYYYCGAVVSNPGDSNQLNDTVFANPYLCSPLTGNYSIGPDAADDFASFSDAVFALNNCGVSGPVVFNVDSGAYNEQIEITAIPGASATNTVTFKGSGNTNIFYESTNSNERAIVTLNGAKHIILDSLNLIIGPNATYGWGVHLWHSADSNTIKNCLIENQKTSNSSNFNGIVASNSKTSYSTSGNNANYLNIHNNNIVGKFYIAICIYGSGTSSLADGITISNNNIQGYYYAGMYLYYHNAVQVIANTIIGTGSYGMYLRYCDNSCKFSKNDIQHAGSYGMYMYYCDGTSSNRLEISNNFVSKTTSYAMYIRYPKYYDVWHNSINVSSGTYGFYFYNSSSSYTGHNITNNNFVHNGSGYAAYIYNNSYITSADYNNYYSPTGSFVYWGGSRADLAALKAAYSTRNQNSVSINPNFFSSTDLHTLCIAFNNLGTPIASITDDIDGDTRSTTAPDIGADEYTPPANDVSVIEWVSPLSGVTPNASMPITIKVANFGTATQSNIPVKYSINGGTVVSGVIAGPILSTDTATYTFTTNANLGTFGMYNCIAYTDLANDQVHLNDTIAYDVFACTPFSGTYTIGADATDDFPTFTDAIFALNSCGVGGPVTFLADTGTFNEQIEITAIPGASATNTVTFKGSGNTNIFYESTNSNERAIVTLNGAKHIILDSLNLIIGPNATYGWGVHLWHSADSNTIKNCLIENQKTSNSSNFNGIVASNSKTSYSTYGNNANYLTIQNNNITGKFYRAICHYGAGSGSSSLAKGVKILNNNIQGYYYAGTYLYYHNAVQVIGNTIIGTGSYGMYLRYCDNSCKFSKNDIQHAGSYGMYMYYCDGTSSNRLEISNNFVSKTTSYGMYIRYPKYYDVWHNSINVSSGSYGFYFYNSSSSYTGHNITNNNFVHNGSGYAAYIYNNSYITSADYNNYYSPTGSFVYWGGSRADLAALKAAYSTRNQNSVSLDPEFVSATDLHTTCINFNDLGTPISSITDDIDGDTRSTTTPDIGADEYTPPANDIGVTALVSPVNQICGSLTDSVNVIINNFGTSNQTNIPLMFIANIPGGTVTLNTIVSSLLSNSSDTIYLGTMNTTLPGTYSVTSYATLITDTIHCNDTLQTSFVINDVFTVPHLETFEGTGPFNWEGTNFTIYSSGAHGLTSQATGVNLYSSVDSAEAYMTNKIGPLTSNSYLTFEYRITDWAGGNATTLNGDSINILISSNCGDTYSVLHTIDTNNHVPSTTMQNVAIPLGSLIGSEVLIGIDAKWASGDYYLDIDNVGIGEPPVADLGPDTSICQGDTFTFDAGTDTIYTLSYDWYIVGNSSSLGTSQYFGADTAGTYYVVVTNEFGLFDTDTVVLTTMPSPMVSFTGLANTYCIDGMDSTLTGTPAGGMFTGTGMTANVFSPATAGVGTFDITYTYTNTYGCTSTDVQSVTVNPLPVVVASPDVAICFGDSTSISVLSPTLIFSEYIEGSSNNKAIELYNATPDTLCLDNYRIAQSVNGNGWAYYHTFPTGAMLAPSATWVLLNSSTSSTYYNTANADEVLSYPSVVHHNGDDARGIQVTSDSGATWTLIDIIGDPDNDPGSGWDVAGVNNATKDHSLVRKSKVFSGNTNWMCAAGTDSLSSEWIVYPQNTFDYLGSHSAVSVTSGTYLWSNAATTQSVMVAPATTTVYTVTVTDANSCTNTDSVVVTVNPLPVVDLGPDQSACDDSLVLDAGAGAGYVYLWSDSSTMQTLTLDSTGYGYGTFTFWVTVVDSLGCMATDSIDITFAPAISVDLGADKNICINNTIDLDAGAGFATYNWSTTEITQTITVDGAALGVGVFPYSVTVTDSNGCMACDTIIITVDSCNSVGEIDNNVSVKIFPNPSNGIFNLSINGISDNINMQILDASGRLIHNEKLTGIKSGYIKEFDVSNFAKGIYYIKLMNNDIIKLEKLIIQ